MSALGRKRTLARMSVIGLRPTSDGFTIPCLRQGEGR